MRNRFNKLPFILCYLCAVAAGLKQLREPDIWWQLKSGEWMLEHSAITRTDMFSYTMQGQPWINVKWLYEVLIAGLEKMFGPHSVILLQIIVNVVIVYLLLRILRSFSKHLGEQVSVFFSTVAVITLLAVSEFRMAGRPEMISHLMTVLYLFILWRSPKFDWKQILWLVPLQCLWANMHEGYPVGMVIIGAYTVGSMIAYLVNKNKEQLQATARIAIVFVAAAIAILLNPNTTTLWAQPFEIFRQLDVNKYTSELLSYKDPLYWTFQAKVNAVMLVAVLLFWIARLIENKLKKGGLLLNGLLAGYLIVILLFGYLSLTANRNIPFSQIALFPSVPVMLLWIVRKLKLTDQPFYANAVKRTLIISSIPAIVFYVLIVSDRYYKFTDVPNKYGAHINILHSPIGAANYIRANDIKGPAFSDYFVSSYMLWNMYPDFKSFIDLRDLDVFPKKFFDDYLLINKQPSRFWDLDSTYKFNYVLLSTSQLTSLHQLLYWSEGFNLVYVDPVCVVMLRDVEANAHINRNWSKMKLFSWPPEPDEPAWAVLITKLMNPMVSYDEEDEVNAPVYAANYYNMVKNYAMSIKLLRPALLTDLSEDPRAFSALGYSYLEYANYSREEAVQKTRLDSAAMLLEKSHELDPGNNATNMGLAGLSTMTGQYQSAKNYLEICKEKDPYNHYVYYLYGIACYNLWKDNNDVAERDEMIENMEHALQLNSETYKAELYLAKGYWEKGDKEDARNHTRKALGDDIPWTKAEQDMLEEMKTLTGVKEKTEETEPNPLQPPYDVIKLLETE